MCTRSTGVGPQFWESCALVVHGGSYLSASCGSTITERLATENKRTYLITKDFDLAVATMVHVRVARILEGVDLHVQRQTLVGANRQAQVSIQCVVG